MSSRYRHRRTFSPSTAFPSPVEPGELIVNTANRQLAVGDAATATLGVPKNLIAVRFFDTQAQYAANDVVVQAGNIYKANGTIPPGAFNASNWTQLGVVTGMAAATVTFTPVGGIIATDVQGAIAELDTEKVKIAGDSMTGHLSLPTGPGAANAVRKDYVDTATAAVVTGYQNADTAITTAYQAADTALGNADTTLQGNIDAKVAKAGDTMTGHLSLPTAPAAANAVRKDYVDAAVAAVPAAPVAATAAEYISNSAPTKMLTPGAAWSAAAPVALSAPLTRHSHDLSASALILFTSLNAAGHTMANPINAKAGQKGIIY